ncbi:glycoside hydrolase family 13 protein [Streptomyces sioyaensis]|uniref:glycoside hydrolase family 13 protein n=1 Tax=Streptomyces sioyaensis TaxID=67364 RepID=UPI0033C842BF
MTFVSSSPQGIVTTTPGTDATWWRQAVVYQIYPRSFADSNGDGVGDLNGITSRADYLQALGVDAVWLSPFYPSALADGGYDVDDYRDVDPMLGTLEDFDRMVAALHARGIKVIVDIVPNHTSNRHAWFRQALAAGRGSDARERYIFREGRGPDGAEPPTDWLSVFGGPAWTRVGDGQWYLHLFAPEQPDLNWNRPDVREDFLVTLRFWADRGVDGFRVDVAHGCAKDMSEPLPTRAELTQGWQGPHPYEDRDEVHEIYASWRQVFNSYDPPRFAVAEAHVPAHRRPRYASAEGLGQAFNFDLLQAPWDAAGFHQVITDNLTLAKESGSSSTWVLSNHDTTRHATRYGLIGADGKAPGGQDGKAWMVAGADPADLYRELGLRRGLAATALILALPGSTYVYQGEELGLHQVTDIPDEARQDPAFHRTPGVEVGRDGCRVPLPWTAVGPSFGFGDASAHLPQPADFARHAVATQWPDPESPLGIYRQLIRTRRALITEEEALTWLPSAPGVLHFARPGGWHCVTNFGVTSCPLPAGRLLTSTRPIEDGLLPANTTVWLQLDSDQRS